MWNSSKQWESLLEMYMEGYEKVGDIGMGGLSLKVYVRCTDVSNVSEIKTQSVATGMGGVVGNKGAVSVSLRFNSAPLIFINAHLSAHEGKKMLRNKEAERIIREMHIESAECAFVAGDLNYRIVNDREWVLDGIQKGQISELLKWDELNSELRDGAWKGWKEKPIDFNPTYKITSNGEYDPKRTPSWTDRILWKGRKSWRVWEMVECVTYKRALIESDGDHLPVCGRYKIFDV